MQQFVDVGGVEVPRVGLGTYRMGEQECAEAVSTALEAGYRHIDTAMAYENEAAVGRAIEESSVDREDVFLTTKVKGYPELLQHDSFLEAAEGCLDRLGTEYVDLLLVHWWSRGGKMDEVMAALNELYDSGQVRNIGVSNFSVTQLREAIRLSDAPILTNQVEYHPYFYANQQELLEYCREQDVLLTAYSPLAEGMVIDDDVLSGIGERYGKSAAQVAIRWSIQQEGVITIPKSVTDRYIQENIEVYDFELSDDEMQRIAGARGPLLYELTKEGSPVWRLRASVGPRVPDPVRKTITSTGAAVMKLIQ